MKSVIRLSSIFALALLVLGAGAAFAQPSSQSAVNVVLDAGNGESVGFDLIAGGAVVIENENRGLSYRLTLTNARHDGADLRVEHLTTHGEVLMVEDIVSLPIDGSFGHLGSSELYLAVTGVTLSATTPAKELAESVLEEPLVRSASCCVNCEGWRICCTAPPGWKCTVTCTATGASCTANGGPAVIEE